LAPAVNHRGALRLLPLLWDLAGELREVARLHLALAIRFPSAAAAFTIAAAAARIAIASTAASAATTATAATTPAASSARRSARLARLTGFTRGGGGWCRGS